MTRPNPDGSFLISNIPAFDGGPGIPPDGWGEDLVRLTGVSTAGGVTRYAWSDFFQVRSGRDIGLNDINFGFEPPPMPESVCIFNDNRLLEIGETAQVFVRAEIVGAQFPDGLDVTRRADGTVYRTSNPAIATVGRDGAIDAVGHGRGFITAVNQGAVAVTRVDILPLVLDTTVEGFVIDQAGQPVQAAQVTTNFGGLANSDALGFFRLPGLVFAPDTLLTVSVEKTIAQVPYFGRAPNLTPVNNGLTDAGIIAIAPLCDPLYFSVGDPVGVAGGSGGVFAIAEFQGSLCAAGAFDFAGGQLVNGVAIWNGLTWSALGGGMNEDVLALTVFDDGNGAALYAAGRFTQAGGQTANRVARWNGVQWMPLGSGMDQTVNVLSVHDDGNGPALYAGGGFTSAGGQTCLRVAKWNGTQWSPVGPGLNQEVFALRSVAEGNQNILYAGGSFTFVGGGGAQCRRIARWNGAAWTQVGPGLNNTVNAIETFDGGSGPALVVGGAFTAPGSGSGTLNRLAQFNGATWDPLGSGVNNTVRALRTFSEGNQQKLYAGGTFAQAAGQAAERIAVWNGSAWSPHPLGGLTDTCNALTVVNNALHVGGAFVRAGGIRVNGIARQTASIWEPLGNGLNDPIDALAYFNGPMAGGVYAGGAFTHAGPQLVNYVARWDGMQWHAAGEGFNNGVFAFAQHDDGTGAALYAGGAFTFTGALAAQHIARWNGMIWQPVGSGINGTINAMVVYNDGGGPQLYVGGSFSAAGNVAASNIARWNGLDWQPVDAGVNGTVHAMTVITGGAQAGLCVGGAFTSAGGVSASRVARWNGTTWSALGAGFNNNVMALSSFNDGLGTALYAGGSFTQSGTTALNRIAKWTGTSWTALNTGAGADVTSLVSYDDGEEVVLVAGGAFTQIGGLSANRIAMWNGAAWSAMSTGLNNRATALLVVDQGSTPDLYVGGDFTTAGGQSRQYLARWARPAVCAATQQMAHSGS